MLDRYLANPPTVTEKLAFPQPAKSSEVVEDMVQATKDSVGEMQASREKGSTSVHHNRYRLPLSSTLPLKSYCTVQ